MKKYIFLAQFDENTSTIEGARAMTLAEGINPQEAFENLKNSEDFGYIGHSGDPENYLCLELVDGKTTEFHL